MADSYFRSVMSVLRFVKPHEKVALDRAKDVILKDCKVMIRESLGQLALNHHVGWESDIVPCEKFQDISRDVRVFEHGQPLFPREPNAIKNACSLIACQVSFIIPNLNVIIQVEEWHSSDRLHGTVRAPRSAQIRALKCRWVSPGGPWGPARYYFDFRGEEQIYDTLERSVDGDLLAQIYLETRRGLELANQGGARAKVEEIELLELYAEPAGSGGFMATATWNVGGSVGHWGHMHQRRNQYRAELVVSPVDGIWKLVDLEILLEERL